MKKFIFSLAISLLFSICSCHRTKTVESFKVDTTYIKQDFLNIIRNYSLTHPNYKSITVYSKLFVEGSEGICADSPDIYTYYIIGPSIKEIYIDKYGHQTPYPTRWFMMNKTYVYLQSGQDEILNNKESFSSYNSHLVKGENMQGFVQQAWLIKTTRDDKCLIVTKRLSDYVKKNPYLIKSPLKIGL